MIRSTAFAVILCVSAAASAQGGDDQPKAPAAKPAPARTADEPTGMKSSVKLTNGRSMSGVIRVAGSWERRDEKTGWTACGKDDAGACIRLWYVSGGEGFLVIAAKEVQSVEDLGALSDADMKKIVSDASASEKRADEERERLHKERAEKKAAEAKEAKDPKKDDKSPDAVKKAELAAAAEKRAAELLAKFPPTEWSIERRDAITKRTLIMHVMPTKEEREFLDNFDTWSKAAAAAAAKAIADKKDAQNSGAK